eukprot:TRINITY_DN33809_c0_g1_i1.p1 TRINITY_DN33809_c0_g1~~TRINITY_DN33809_c0_g1_i1.p1  ORF type:complete len:542 (+),score=108.86 TRINITY_DN33809_c0_g1_i1:79-1626(+)
MSLSLAAAVATQALSAKPHVLMVLADDFGWANVGYHNSDDEVVTPVINQLVKEGVELDRQYAYKFCSPSRCSLQSGRLPVNVNVMNAEPTVSNPEDPVGGYAGIPINMTTIAQKLSAQGYRTHMTGKWDAGMATDFHTPIGRGYQTWFGYYHHANDYWTEKIPIAATGTEDVCGNAYVDLWENNGPAVKLNGSVYEEIMFTNSSVSVIEQHDPSQPLFLFHSFHLMHTPLEVPQDWLDKFSFINDTQRKTYAAMVNYLDTELGKIVDTFKKKEMWNNTLMVLISDNGGPIYYPAGGNNHPLKGGKMSDWEGGVRVNAFVSGGFVPEDVRGTKYESFVHIADWYATIATLAGADLNDEVAKKAGLPAIDGVNQWDAIINRKVDAPRTVVHLSENAVISNGWKLITGIQSMSGWTPEKYPTHLTPQPTYPNDSPVDNWNHNCTAGCLYHIVEDALELHDVSTTFPSKLTDLMTLLKDLNANNYNPVRGKGNKDACKAATELYHGFYGPFIGVWNNEN